MVGNSLLQSEIECKKLYFYLYVNVTHTMMIAISHGITFAKNVEKKSHSLPLTCDHLS